MIQLSAVLDGAGLGEQYVARLTTNANLPYVLRPAEALLLDEAKDCDHTGYKAVFVKHSPPTRGDEIALPSAMAYLSDGDIVRFNPATRALRVLYRRSSPNNSLLVTERCNSRCLMCSQPPRDIDDAFIVEELLTAIPLMAQSTKMIGFTGGEITLLHDGFIRLVRAMKNYLPFTRTFVLTNGRLLCYAKYAQKIADVQHPHLILCVPLYSDVDSLHDFVVQTDGAFDQTIRGILNLGRAGIATEIRVVIHQQTYRRLAKLATFISRNFPFVAHVALMGLEMTGFTKANIEALWIDPSDYQRELSDAVEILSRAGIDVSIYNHQLCVLSDHLWEYSRHSISDWKNIYMPECAECSKKSSCGGFFASAPLRYSRNIQPFE